MGFSGVWNQESFENFTNESSNTFERYGNGREDKQELELKILLQNHTGKNILSAL